MRILEIIRKAKDKPCTDCNIKYNPWQMDFDHIDANKKLANVSAMLYASVEKVVEEISKCEVVCSNCHRQRTYMRKIDDLELDYD